MTEIFGDILGVIASVGSIAGGSYTTYRWYMRKHSNIIYYKKYCEYNFLYFKSFVNKLIYKNISKPLPDGRFINYDLALKNGSYANDVETVNLKFSSKIIKYLLPYKREIDYIIDSDSKIQITGNQLLERFELEKELKDSTDPVLKEFISAKPTTTDGPAIRMKSFVKVNENTYQCELQQASYFDQVRTNLTLDVPIKFDETVRILDMDSSKRLKDLSESVMANTIGVSAIWFTECRNIDKSDRLRFYLRPRRESTGVFSNMLGTVSGVVEPPPNNIFTESTLEEFMIKEIRREFYQETGYDHYLHEHSMSEETVKIIPLAFMRELTRGGKPQFFFAINTPYATERELAKYFKLSYNGKEEFYSDFRSRFVIYNLSPETMVNLMLTYKYIQRKQNLPYIDFA